MRGADLQGKIIRDETGRKLGRLDELHIRDGVVTMFVCGPLGMLQRFTPSRAGRRFAWSAVKAVTDREIIVITSRRGEAA